MSTRTISVKTINHNNKHNNSNFVQSSKPHPTVSKAPKNNNHVQQQPKKNNNKNGRKNNYQKKVAVASSPSSSEDDSSSLSSEDDYYGQNKKTMRKKQHQFEYKSLVDEVYAGPTFNNAPLPSALPIPAFNARGSPINYPQPLYHSVNPSLQQQSLDLMNLISPQKVVTAFELEKTNLALSEIQQGLRSMLKIES